MDENIYRFLKWTAITLGLVAGGWLVYEEFFQEKGPGLKAYREAEILFEDGHYERALQKYDLALEAAPKDVDFRRSKARTLMQLGRLDEAKHEFNAAIALAPDFGPTYANRGILHDRMGEHAQAAADYERALRLEPKLAEGPNWLTRFLRLQPEKPPTIADRAQYLREQLAKPESERVLRIRELDAQQRPYKQ